MVDDRVEELIAERDAARERVRELEFALWALWKMRNVKAEVRLTDADAPAQTVTLSLGGVCPGPPSTWRGTIWNNPAAAAVLRNVRRWDVVGFMAGRQTCGMPIR